MHLITTIDKDDLRVCFFSEENVEMVLDSASTEHIFNINECFFTAIEPSRASVLTGGGKITAVAKGNVELFLTNEDDEEDRVKIRDCLRIPNMPVNILSISKLAKNGITLTSTMKNVFSSVKVRTVAYYIASSAGLWNQMKDLVYTFHNSQNHMQGEDSSWSV